MNIPLDGIQVLSQSDLDCVLGIDGITIGVQTDGMVFMAPHQETEFTVSSAIAGHYNRSGAGHFFIHDDYGGFTLNPIIPAGTGRQARVSARNLEFTGLFHSAETITKQKPGWRVQYYLSPGERIAFSVFPPREFP